ncbi:YhgE/Pip domain-containing protein [Jeotgalibacillus proteolyticus]|nr:YhgE/Pip domain-containing protein [Jeotgalibacillus proteolyticus]
MKFKRTGAAFTAILLAMPTLLVSAETNDTSKEEDSPQGEGSFSAKHEVVYATLTATGEPGEMYVVNNFTVEEPGKLMDYGPYSSVQNLTDLTGIEQEGNEVQFTAKENEFYYQGNLDNMPLPWNFTVTYLLDGKEIDPNQLPGEDGEIELQIETTKNDSGEELFFENYLMQISLTLDSNRFKNIEAEDGALANAGKDRQVTFTVLPEKEETFSVRANVTDFEMNAIEIAAVPSSMSIDAPDTDEMQQEMMSLSDATAEVNRGVGGLKDGISELNSGVAMLFDGSAQYRDGISQLQANSSELVNGSASIQSALQQMNDAVGGAGSGSGMDVSQFSQLGEGLRQIAGGLQEVENGLSNLSGQYAQANEALGQSINSIPEASVSEEDIQALYESGADPAVVDGLVENYQAAQTVKGTYAAAGEAFQAISPALDTSAGSLNEMSSNLTAMADQLDSSLASVDIDESIAQLQGGLETLSANYNAFHSGLTEYTGGVDRLAGSYQEVYSGISGLTGGTAELEGGASRLHNGTAELASATSDLPDQIQVEIDEMISEFDKSDFEPVSFVSNENENVEAVQFVIKTESIQKDEDDQEEESQDEEKSFWDRLLDLFR